MKIIKAVKGKSPQISDDCFIAENATIVGEVTIGKQCSVWFNAVIRGDVHYIKSEIKSIFKTEPSFMQPIKNHQPRLGTMFLLVIMQLFMVVPFKIMC